MTREIDARVAEAMGYEILDVGYLGCSGDSLLTPHESPRQVELQDWMGSVDLDSIGQYYIDVASNWWRGIDDWTPSTDIAAAWQVVEWMNCEKKWIVRVISLWGDGGAEVEICSDQGHPSYWYDIADADAAVVPEAICCAFLAAMGVEVPDET
jgi:hypothetical protein